MKCDSEKTVSWLSTALWQRRLVIWFFWAFTTLVSIIAIEVGIWPLALHVVAMAIVMTFIFKRIESHGRDIKEFGVDPDKLPDISSF